MKKKRILWIMVSVIAVCCTSCDQIAGGVIKEQEKAISELEAKISEEKRKFEEEMNR